MIIMIIQFATTHLITNVIGMFWRNIMNRGIWSINYLLFIRYGSYILSVDNEKNNFPGRGRLIETESERRFIRSLI